MLKHAYSVSVMACVSACVKLVHGPVQTGDTNGEPRGPQRVISVTAPVPRDATCEARSAFRERRSRARLRGGISAQERPAFRERPSRGRLKCRRVLGEFGTRGFPCARVCGASRAAYRVFCSRNARSGFPGRCARAGLHGKPCRLGARVTSSVGISWHECRGNSARSPMWGTPRERALVEMCRVTSWLHGSAIGETLVSPRGTNGHAVNRHHGAAEEKKKPRSEYTAPDRMWQAT